MLVLSPALVRSLGALGVVALSVLMVALAPDIRETAPSQSASLPSAEDAADMEAVLAEPETGTGEASGEMERLPPRPPLSEPPLPRGPEPTLLYQPIASAAGRIEAGGHVVEIAGVAVTDPGRRCAGSDGSEWACGMAARTAFRNWLRGRAVLCTVSPEPSREPVVTDCTVGREEAGAWLVENGFAEAEADGPYAEAGQAAQDEGRGIFGQGR